MDHEGEVLESFASKNRDKPAALEFMKKLHGRAKVITIDGLRLYKAAMKDLGNAENRRWDGGPTTRWRTLTCPSDERSGPWSASGR